MVLKRAFGIIGVSQAESANRGYHDYPTIMADILQRLRYAERQIQEATTLEDLDIGRSALLSAQAEVQQLVRNAKRERGISVRPISETEEIHRNLRNYMNHRTNHMSHGA